MPVGCWILFGIEADEQPHISKIWGDPFDWDCTRDYFDLGIAYAIHPWFAQFWSCRVGFQARRDWRCFIVGETICPLFPFYCDGFLGWSKPNANADSHFDLYPHKNGYIHTNSDPYFYSYANSHRYNHTNLYANRHPDSAANIHSLPNPDGDFYTTLY